MKANVTYEVSIDADWIKENGTKALTSKTYTFDIDANASYDSREGVITIKEKNGNNVETIKVKQAQKDAIIISSKEYSLSSDAQTLEVKLQTNVDLEVVIPEDAKTWISHTETKALSDKTVIFDIKANETYDARNSKIVIKKKSTGIADTIKIAQAQKNAIIISKKDFELSSEAHTLEVKLQTNVDISVSVSETAKNWISHTQTKALTDKTLIVDIKSNDTYGERLGEIYISSSKSNMRDTIKIKQLQNDAIIISQKEYNLSSEAQTLEVKLQTNVDLEVVIPDEAKSWVSHTETKALSSRSIIFDIKANEYSDTRRCDIIIKKKTTGIADTIKIAQAQKSIIIISKKNYKLSSDAHTLEIPFQSNVEISVAIPEHSKNWISYIQTKALTDKALVIDVKQNDTYSERYGEVYIYNSKSNMRDTINITQLQNEINDKSSAAAQRSRGGDIFCIAGNMPSQAA